MNRRLSVIVFCLLFFASCNSKETGSTTNAPANSTSNSATNSSTSPAANNPAAVKSKVDPCSLLTSNEIKLVQGEAFAKVMKHMTAPLTRQRYNTLRRLPHIKAPTLILWGTDDKTNDFALGGEIQAGITGSKLKAYEGTGHRLPQEQPARFVQDVLEFLR